MSLYLENAKEGNFVLTIIEKLIYSKNFVVVNAMTIDNELNCSHGDRLMWKGGGLMHGMDFLILKLK